MNIKLGAALLALSVVVMIAPAIAGAQTSFCHTFNVNLQKGNTGNEVVALQQALELNLGYSGHPLLNAEAGVFGNYTFSAVVSFQSRNIAQIGVANGSVGTYTRLVLNQLYSCSTGSLSFGLSVATDPMTSPAGNLRAGSTGNEVLVFDLKNTLANRAIQINTIKVTELTGAAMPEFSRLYLSSASGLGQLGIATVVNTNPYSATFQLPPRAMILAPGSTQVLVLRGDVADSATPGAQVSFTLGLGAVSGVNPDLAATVTGIGVAQGNSFTILPEMPQPLPRPMPMPQPMPGPTPKPMPQPMPGPVPMPPAANRLPIGYHDTLSCTVIQGWTCDLDNVASPLTVVFYMDNPIGRGGTFVGSTIANAGREAAGLGT